MQPILVINDMINPSLLEYKIPLFSKTTEFSYFEEEMVQKFKLFELIVQVQDQ